MAPDNFHLFLNLPQEIQDIIWKLCIPQRVIRPFYDEDELERLDGLPGIRGLRDLPVQALIPFRPPLISRVCRAARATALGGGQYAPVSIDDEDLSPCGGTIWLNRKSDWIYFSFDAMLFGLDKNGSAPQVYELARDVGVPLLIDIEIYTDLDMSFSQTNETVGSRLYNNFLRRRDHFYCVMAEVTLVVSGKGRERVVETGLFGLLGEDTAIVPTTDTETLRQYQTLFNNYDIREETNGITLAQQDNLKSLINGEDQGGREPRTLVWRLLERICDERSDLNIEAEDLTNKDGSVNPHNPVVQSLGISMPTFTKVVIFELRHLDTLLKDSTSRLS